MIQPSGGGESVNQGLAPGINTEAARNLTPSFDFPSEFRALEIEQATSLKIVVIFHLFIISLLFAIRYVNRKTDGN